MVDLNSPSEIAREVLRRLATRRIPPTPENFREIYHEILGSPPEEGFPERSLRQIVTALPRVTPEQLKVARQFEAVIAEKSWLALKQQLVTMVSEQAEEPLNWNALIREVLVQVERRQSGLNSFTKQEALSRVLEGSVDPTLLHSRLQGLIKGWALLPAANSVDVAAESAPVAAASAVSEPAHVEEAKPGLAAAPEEWRILLASLLETAVGMLLIDTPELAGEATALGKVLRDPVEGAGEAFDQRLKQFAYKVQWAAQDQSYIRQALLNLLQLIIENIGELVIEDKWLQGQMSVLLELFSRPLDKNSLAELGERLRDVIHKQGTIKRSLTEAQNRLREMLAFFVDRLGELAESTGNYHGKITAFAERISTAGSLQELAGLVDDIAKETQTVEQSARRSQAELQSLRTTVDQAHKEIARLETELSQASEMVRHDPLTGALNRKGFEEMLEREMARQVRRSSLLSISLLDVDNFKALNDTYGHATGDDALRHLAMVIRENLRPQDSCARYGGEEFLVLLPDTGMEDAAIVMRRLQRELTKRFFLHENQKLLITFSAGVTEIKDGEAPEEAIGRADKAMYSAKRQGKNRVEIG
ncbi:GGDEF domain-containing protein [Uliginosibacterium gangwonense]|uniref:GGDEF domain-containing protein n=1 Tax=Uliginosibacterium gangwonense TaxID=392736 RepID=UPI00037F0F88|nr:GGDEF domain-containing protein [Uliginosibacterium gangwonense]